MSRPLTLPDSPNVTFSQGSESGPWRFVLPDGRTVDQHGLAHALASLSARQVKALGLQTSGIYGPPGSTSSTSVALQSSLENRLRKRLNGSALCRVTWKEWITPWGVCLSRPRAQVVRTSGTVSTLWPTASKTDSTGRGYHKSGGRVYLALPGALMVSLGMPYQCPQTRRISGAFYCCLMGLPMSWHQSRPMATRLTRGRRKPSSKATAKPETSNH